MKRDTQHNGRVVMLNGILLIVVIMSVVMLSVVMLNVVMSVVMLNVVILSVVVPTELPHCMLSQTSDERIVPLPSSLATFGSSVGFVLSLIRSNPLSLKISPKLSVLRKE